MALSADRKTQQMGASPLPELLNFPVKTGVTIYAGALVAVESATGYLLPVTAAAGLIVVGRAEKYVAAGASASGTYTCNVRPGCFKWVNKSTDALADTEIGTGCYGYDDQTVCKTGGSKSPAGIVVKVDSDGVWVMTAFMRSADDTLIAHLAGAETLTGIKTFNAAPVIGAGLTASGSVANDFSGATGHFKTPTSTSNLFTFNQKIAAGASSFAIADPGTAQAIPVTANAVINLTIGSAGAETNTLAIPTFIGQRLTIHADTVGTGTRAITAASAINQAGNTIMTFGAASDFIALIGVTLGGTRCWRVLANDGVALS